MQVYNTPLIKFFCLIIIVFLLAISVSNSQSIKLSCIEKERKNEEGKDSIQIKTCFIKNFKFVSTSYPDYAGRYVYSEQEVYVRKKDKYIKTTNSNVFNKNQSELLATINKKILQDFHSFASDSNTKKCLTEIDSLPTYKMDDLEISFYGDKIWFEVHWGLSGACRNADGTIVTFKVNEIKKYFK